MNTLTLVLLLTFAQADEPRWVSATSDPGRLYLYRGTTQVGGYDLAEHFYQPFDGKGWGERCEPPIPPPCFGVAAGKVGIGPKYRLGDRVVTAETARDSLRPSFDESKIRVTLIGPKDVRETARRELESHPEFIGLGVVVRDYGPDHWAVSPGFVTSGSPTIYCQSPDGQVLHRQDDFVGGADTLVAALRKARDGYDPSRDPDLRRGIDWQRPAGLAAAGLAGAVAIGVVRRRRG